MCMGTGLIDNLIAGFAAGGGGQGARTAAPMANPASVVRRPGHRLEVARGCRTARPKADGSRMQGLIIKTSGLRVIAGNVRAPLPGHKQEEVFSGKSGGPRSGGADGRD